MGGVSPVIKFLINSNKTQYLLKQTEKSCFAGLAINGDRNYLITAPNLVEKGAYK